MSEPRKCLYCDTPLVQRANERNSTFKIRACCNRACGVSYGHQGKRAKNKPHIQTEPMKGDGDPGRSLSKAEILRLVASGQVTPLDRIRPECSLNSVNNGLPLRRETFD